MPGVVNPVSGVTNQFGRALNKFKPKIPLPVPVSRSFLFELIDTETKMIKNSFSLVVPPNAVSIREPQRVSVTKTFGNVFVDDYGADNLQIIIRGFSGTSHAWPTFTVEGPDAMSAKSISGLAETFANLDAYTHRTGFFAFRDNIIRYKQNDKENFGKLKLRVYDLYDEQSYDCVLMEFACDRTADRPLYYPYTITLLVYNMPDSEGDQKPEFIVMGGLVDKIISGIETGLTWMEGGFAFVTAIKNSVAIISNTLDLVSKRLATFATDTASLAASPLDLTKQLIEQVGSLSTAVESAYSNYLMTKDSYLNAKESIQNLWRNTIKLYHQAISQGAQSSRRESIPFDRGLSIPSGSGLHVGYTGSELGVAEASRDVSVETQQFNGVNLYTVKGMDTLQSIAQAQMGDSSLWPYLASVNDIVDNVELHAREQIYVPVQTQATTTQKDSFIVTENPLRDPYGSDFRLDSSGNLVLNESNDTSLVSGLENIQQWVDSLFKTPLGSVLKHTTLGLYAPGMPGDETAIKYLRMSCRTALMADPRIAAVTDLQLSIEADVVTIGMDLEIVGYDRTLPVTVTL